MAKYSRSAVPSEEGFTRGTLVAGSVARLALIRNLGVGVVGSGGDSWPSLGVLEGFNPSLPHSSSSPAATDRLVDTNNFVNSHRYHYTVVMVAAVFNHDLVLLFSWS